MIFRAGREQRGQHRRHRCRDAHRETKPEQAAMLRKHQPLQRTPAESDRLQQSQFAAAFQDISQHHDAEARAAEQQAQSAQNLERVQIRVLHGIKRFEPLRRGREFESHILQRARHRGGGLLQPVRFRARV